MYIIVAVVVCDFYLRGEYMSALLEVKGLCHRYNERLASLRDINFTLARGESLAIVGANGSGKSTLLQLISACLKPASGDILLEGQSVYENVKNARRQIGMVFQDPDDQLFMPTVWEDVAFGVLNRGVALSEARDMALAALDKVCARHLADRESHRLSGGEKRVAALATVFIMNPSVLLLDEPTNALDPKARRNLIELLAQREYSKIIATHDLDMALEICDRVIFLDNGKMAGESIVPGLLLDESFLKSVNLELPLSYT